MFCFVRNIGRKVKAATNQIALLPLLPIFLGLALGAIVFAIFMRDATSGGNIGESNGVASQIKFRETSLHLGKLRTGDVKSCEFEFTNIGRDTIVIQSLNASCDCTEVHWPKTPIAAGQSGVIRATLTATRTHSESTAKLNVHFRSGESLRTELPIQLSITVTICDDVRINPPELEIDDDGSSQPNKDLVVQRDLLAPDAFVDLKLKTPPCLQVSERERSPNTIIFKLTLIPRHVVSELNSVNLEYGKPTRRVIVPVRVNHIVRLTPASFFVRVRGKQASNLKEATRNSFQIASSKYNRMKIMSIGGDEGLVGRTIDGSRFSLWLKDLPGKVLYGSALTISYSGEHEGQEIHGHVGLPLRILVEP